MSIVIPCYNGERFLSEAIESALQQTFREIEVIVVDDGSTDSSAEIARSYGEKVRYVFQQNAGLSGARNTGIRVATRDLVIFLDADDRLRPEMAATMVGAIEKLPEEFALVACDSDLIDSNSRPLARKFRPAPLVGEITVRDLIFMNRFPCTVVAKREVFSTCGNFDTTLKSAEDRDMWIRIATQRRIQLLPQSLVEIRRHGENMSGNASRQSRNMRRVLRKAYQSAAVPKHHLLFWSKAVSIYLFQSGFMFAEGGSNFKATLSFLGSLCLWPFYLKPSLVSQPRLFRIRRLARIGVDTMTGVFFALGRLKKDRGSDAGQNGVGCQKTIH